jgi:hypothetical protein
VERGEKRRSGERRGEEKWREERRSGGRGSVEKRRVDEKAVKVILFCFGSEKFLAIREMGREECGVVGCSV